MEYDEQVSARLDMSLDEIIGQEQQDGSGQMKKRKAKSGFTGVTRHTLVKSCCLACTFFAGPHTRRAT